MRFDVKVSFRLESKSPALKAALAWMWPVIASLMFAITTYLLRP